MKKPSIDRPSRRRSARAGILVALCAALLCACAGRREEEPRFPGAEWGMYAAPEEAGWSSERLASARAFYAESGSDAFLAVFDGAVLVSWGEVSRRYMCHSVRKSFLSALVGIYAAEGKIGLGETLGELGIDDEPPLSTEERLARVVHLLQSRSGVYHAAAYETPAMKKERPERGSKQPGEFWYYNNWDFNALCTIFERTTGAGIFEAFDRRIAVPLQMEDFRLMDTYYHLERQHSIHPAYPFRMSARDMARFGLLYLREGMWQNLEIVPEEWVEASRLAYSKVPSWEGYGYGYMWWVNIDESDSKFGMYAALGYGGHAIAVLPDENLVIVNRADTYLGEATEKAALLRLIDMVLDAKVSPPKPNPRIVPLEVETGRGTMEPEAVLRLADYEVTFRFGKEEIFAVRIPLVIGDMIGRTVRLEADGRRLLMIDDLGQRFVLVPRSAAEFFVEDMEIPVLFEMDDRGRPVAIVLDASPAWRIRGERVAPSGREDRREREDGAAGSAPAGPSKGIRD